MEGNNALFDTFAAARGRRVEMARIAKRVVCVSHALTPDHVSTQSIMLRMKEQRITWANKSTVDFDLVDWLRFPVYPPTEVGDEPLEVRFKIIPLMGEEFATAPKKFSYYWTEQAVKQIINEARRDGVDHLIVGLGAYTKRATNHGLDLLKLLEGFSDIAVTFNHGDIGTAGLAFQMIRNAGLSEDLAVAVVGATGAIGGLIAKMFPEIKPSRLVLIGKHANDERLVRLKGQIDLPDEVITVSGDLNDCKNFQCTIVVVAGGELEGFPPTAVNEGTLVLDVSAPNACRPNDGWAGRLGYAAGNAQVSSAVLPNFFGSYNGEVVRQVNVQDRGFWGCMTQVVCAGLLGRREHLVGQNLDLWSVPQCMCDLAILGGHPQDRKMFGREVTGEEERQFVGRMLAPSLESTKQAVNE